MWVFSGTWIPPGPEVNGTREHLGVVQVLREKYGVSCFLGLTATATKSTAADVAHHLGITDMDAATVRGSPVPPNLCLSVSRDENKDEVRPFMLFCKGETALPPPHTPPFPESQILKLVVIVDRFCIVLW